MCFKKLTGLALSLFMIFGITTNVAATEVNGILDTNNEIITVDPGTVVDTGESSEGYTGVKATPYANNYYFYSDPTPVSTADKGKLYSHAERQRFGDISGNVRTFRYYIYSKYEGNGTVEKISSQWYTTAKLRSSATLSLSTSLGNEVSVSAGIESTWQNVKSPTKKWTNSNGSKITYEQSNFAVSPDRDLYSFEVGIVHTSKVKLKGDAKTYTLTSGC